MASPETPSLNTEEAVEREAPILERVEHPRTPERQVERALADAESLKAEYDPGAADAEMSRDQSGYAARLGMSGEAIAEADAAIADELSTVRQEETGALAKLNAKLRKYAGAVALVAATGSAYAAEEAPAESAPMVDGSDIVETISEDAIPKPEIPKVFQMNTSPSSLDVAEASSGKGNQESFFQEVAKDHAQEQSGNERFLEQQKADEYVERMQKDFEQMEFSNEEEMLDFLREIAENGPFEFFVVYGMDDFGHLKKFSGGFGSGTRVETDPKILQDAKTQGITKLTLAHTHPNATVGSQEVQNAFSTEERQWLYDRGRMDMPPSGADVRMTGELDWMDYYDDPMKFEGRDGVETRGVVVTSDGVWRYRTDFFHPAMERQRAEVIRFIEEDSDFQEWKSKNGLSDDEAHDILRIVQVPDNLVRARVLTNPKYREAFRGFNFYNFITNARIGTELNEDRSQFAWIEEQKKVALASPEEKTAAVEKFTDFCKKNGVEMWYIPFEKQN